MFDQLLKAAGRLADAELPADLPASLFQAVPKEVSINDVNGLVLQKRDTENRTSLLWAVYAVLKTRDNDELATRNREQADMEAAIAHLFISIGGLIKPVCSGASFDEDTTDYAELSRNGILGLRVLTLLTKLGSTESQVLPSETLNSILGYTNPADPWTTSSSAELAQELLETHFQRSTQHAAIRVSPSLFSRSAERDSKEKKPVTEQERFITEDLMLGFLRPIFARSRPTNITASGRPAAYPEPPSRYSQGEGFGGSSDDVTTTKPWKYAQQYAVTVFEWAVKNADTSLLSQHWPLYTPILLTLLDEFQPISFKLRSLSIFRLFWSKCPDGLMARTGLTEVFEQAVFPTVLSLPSLTPPTESLTLLRAAYPALFDIAGLDTSIGDNQEREQKQFSESQRKSLDKIVREGIMVGFHHAKEHVRLADFFCQILCRLVNGMGIITVKYLKVVHPFINSAPLIEFPDIMPLISELLCDPFGTKYPPTLLAAIHLLQTVLQNCWPRMSYYCNEVIKVTMVCYLNVAEEDSFPAGQPTKAELNHELSKSFQMLSAIMTASDEDMASCIDPLIAKEPQLAKLFKSTAEAK
ncbi:hypothetical protein GGR57DRAFT_497871 [Xylariaceae sp. FL1272]|nr:hypothetical protein GGR57DRAFT_497871 [Xylariaceae sp. FL1272]